MRVALWARYSSKMQDEMSLEAQLYEMEQFVARQASWEIVARYLLPEMRSSELERAPEFERMMFEAREKRFDMLLCHKLDRLGRDREMVVITKSRLRRMGIEIRSVVENLGESLEHRLLEGVFEVFADYYSKNLGQETKKGHRALVRGGYWTGGTVPWGCTLEVVQDGKSEHKRLVPCPVRGPIMRELFARLASGERTGQILDWVHAKTGERWPVPSFYSRVRNHIYYGLIQYQITTMPAGRKRKRLPPEERVTGRWQGLVSEEIWSKANKALQERTFAMRGRERARPEAYLLSGKVTCLKCGKPIIGNVGGGRYKNAYYVCSGRREKTCPSVGLRVDDTDAAVLAAVRQVLEHLDEEAVTAHFESMLSPYREAARKDEARLRNQLTELQIRKRRLTDAIEQGAVELHLVGARLRELSIEEAELVDRIAVVQLEADARIGLNKLGLRDLLESLRTDLAEQGPDPMDIEIALRHLFQIRLDLEKGEGQLVLQLPLCGPIVVLPCGRSARI